MPGFHPAHQKNKIQKSHKKITEKFPIIFQKNFRKMAQQKWKFPNWKITVLHFNVWKYKFVTVKFISIIFQFLCATFSFHQIGPVVPGSCGCTGRPAVFNLQYFPSAQLFPSSVLLKWILSFPYPPITIQRKLSLKIAPVVLRYSHLTTELVLSHLPGFHLSK